MDLLTLDALSQRSEHLTEQELTIQGQVRRFVRERFLPRAPGLFLREEFPRELVPELAALGLLGASISGNGCAGLGAVEYGLVLEELEYGDSGLRSFVSVQGSLAMYAIHAYGSDEQKAQFLPRLARGELVGCFGLTEPDSGSDPASMLTRARPSGADHVLSGTKTWITNAPIADVAIVWAKVGDGGAESIQGFIVERGMPGFETPRIEGKLSLRISDTGQLVLDGCRVPQSHVLPKSRGLRSPLGCLNQARLGIAWGAIGAAKACFESTTDYARQRRAFGAPIARKQLVQSELADMGSEIVKADLLNLHYARLKDRQQGKIRPEQVSLCKRNNVAAALDIARRCRAILGANGILADYPPLRHALNLESVYTYEGTHEVHTLVLGKGFTGEDGF
jgi:glutaryl-CoA dehydrogenase